MSDEEIQAALLAARAAHPAPDFRRRVEEIYRAGGPRQRRVVLRTLVLFEQPRQFLGLALEAAQSMVGEIFEAIACDNPYPSRYFSDSSFHRMVVRALSLGLSPCRIVGLELRLAAASGGRMDRFTAMTR
ncbi:MAG: EboA domain-containing protein [Elusimicrobia bacterium]|nr:EboA domain-containing protein [Elusimicrobiota bacterium]